MDSKLFGGKLSTYISPYVGDNKPAIKFSIVVLPQPLGPIIVTNSPEKIFKSKLDIANFLEFFTYRWLEHCGTNFDNDIGYRSKKEYISWKKKDPLNNYIKKLIKLNL